MATVSGPRTISDSDLYRSTTQAPSGYSLGDLAYGPNGKAYRLALAGASALVVGNLLQSAANDTQFDDMAVPAAVAVNTWDAGVTITNGTTAVTAGQYVGGSLLVSVTPGLGEEYTIVDHGTATNGSSWTLYLDRPLRTAWTTSTKVTVRRSPWSGVIQFPATTQTGIPVGVAIYPIPAAEYGWVQTKGMASVLSDGSTFAIGSEVGTPSGTAGCITVFAAGTTKTQVGYALRAAASGKTIPVHLQID